MCTWAQADMLCLDVATCAVLCTVSLLMTLVSWAVVMFVQPLTGSLS